MIQEVYKICTHCKGKGQMGDKKIIKCPFCEKGCNETDLIIFDSGDPRPKSIQLKQHLDVRKPSRST